MKVKTGLVLSGGGARGIAHAGVLQAADHHIDFRRVDLQRGRFDAAARDAKRSRIAARYEIPAQQNSRSQCDQQERPEKRDVEREAEHQCSCERSAHGGRPAMQVDRRPSSASLQPLTAGHSS